MGKNEDASNNRCQLADRNELPSNHFDKIGRVDETIGTINAKTARNYPLLLVAWKSLKLMNLFEYNLENFIRLERDGEDN